MRPDRPRLAGASRIGPWLGPLVLGLIVAGWLTIRDGLSALSVYGIGVVLLVVPLVIVCGVFLAVIALLLAADQTRVKPPGRVGKIVWPGDEKHVPRDASCSAGDR